MLFETRLVDALRRGSPEAADRIQSLIESTTAEIRRIARQYRVDPILDRFAPEGGARLTQLPDPVCPWCALTLTLGGSQNWVCTNCQFEISAGFLERTRGTARRSRRLRQPVIGTTRQLPVENDERPEANETRGPRMRTICLDDDDS